METSIGNQVIKIIWEKGTAYDLFASLHVLHYPAKYGLRAAWAAGVRSRLSQEDREFLENVFSLFQEPFLWVDTLPQPKVADTALYAIKQIPPDQRLVQLKLFPIGDKLLVERLGEVQDRGSWTEDDLDFFTERVAKPKGGVSFSPKKMEKILGFYANTEAFGDAYLAAFQSYNEVFFAEEEKRIAPKIDEALENAQQRAKELPFLELLEELSRGLQFEEFPGVTEIILVPTYWLSPLFTEVKYGGGQEMMLFGGRSPGESLVPGEIVPEDLLQILKALADPSRLRVLRYLMQEELTQAELARRLRLRAPTLTHHLHILRLAGLVRLVMRGQSERLYFARMESIKGTYAILKDFLEQDVVEVESVDLMDRDRIY
jgi:DNA-binding transcriptional ArsR family regulator